MRIRQGASKPDLVLNIRDDARADGLVPLTTATLVQVVGYRQSIEVFRANAVNVTDAGGLVHLWAPAHTAVIGDLEVVIEVTWIDGKQFFEISELIEVYAISALSPIVSLQALIDHMSGITLDSVQWSAAETVLNGVQRGLERALNRRFTEAEVTEAVYPDPVTGWAMVSRSPVRQVLSIGGTVLTADEALGRSSPNGINVGGFVGYGYFGGVPYAVSVKYVGGGGLDPEDLADVKLAVLEKTSAIVANRHDDARTAQDLDSRAPAPVKETRTWTSEDLDTWGMSRLRRRVIA